MQSSRSADGGVVKPRAQCLCWPGSSSQPTVSSHTDGWVGLKFGCHDVWRMWFCAKHKTCAAAEKLWPANVVHTCQKEGASTRSGFFFSVFSLCFDLLYTLDIITGHWNRAFFKTPLMVKKLFSVLPSGRKQTEFLERWCRHAHVYQCL